MGQTYSIVGGLGSVYQRMRTWYYGKYGELNEGLLLYRNNHGAEDPYEDAEASKVVKRNTVTVYICCRNVNVVRLAMMEYSKFVNRLNAVSKDRLVTVVACSQDPVDVPDAFPDRVWWIPHTSETNTRKTHELIENSETGIEDCSVVIVRRGVRLTIERIGAFNEWNQQTFDEWVR